MAAARPVRTSANQRKGVHLHLRSDVQQILKQLEGSGREMRIRIGEVRENIDGQQVMTYFVNAMWSKYIT